MTYTIPLTEAGKIMYAQREQDIERAVIFFIERIGPDQWTTRKRAIHDRYMAKLKARQTPVEGISLRDRADEFGWYLFLAETSIADPPAVDSDQANRAGPYLSAVGRKLKAIEAIENIDLVLDRLTRALPNQDPDQALFELLVAATYVEDGWTVQVVVNKSTKTPDFEIKRGTRRFEVECKRYTRRSEYSETERDHWLRQWRPTGQWLFRHRHSLILNVTFEEEVQKVAPGLLEHLVSTSIAKLLSGEAVIEPGIVTVTAQPVDYSRIGQELKSAYVKQASARERELIIGIHRRDGGFTSSILGRLVSVGPRSIAGNKYWERIEYVNGAHWVSQAPASLDAKARSIMTRLSEATKQFTGKLPGIVHIGIEAEEDAIELIRARKIREALRRFDPRGQPVEWIFVHYFRGESMPEGNWNFDETFDWHGQEPEFFRPLRTGFVVLPPEVLTREGHHFEPVSSSEPSAVSSDVSNFNSQLDCS